MGETESGFRPDEEISSQVLDDKEFWRLARLSDAGDLDAKARLHAHNAAIEAKKKISSSQLSETGAPFSEFQFYQDSFEGMAKRHNKRTDAMTQAPGIKDRIKARVDRLVEKNLMKNDKRTRPDKITKEYVMQERAERENLDIRSRLDQERQEWNSLNQTVFQDLRAKRDDPNGAGQGVEVGYVSFAAGLRGPYGGGQEIGLNMMGYTANKFKFLAGASSGMADVVYFAGGPEQTLVGNSIYYDECNTKEFLDFTRLSGVLDAKVPAAAMRTGEKAVDQEAVRNCPAEVYAIVTPVKGERAKLVDIKTAKPDMIAPVEASMNVRLLLAPGTEVNGELLEDGGFGTIAIQEIIDKFRPTDGKRLSLLITPNISWPGFKNLGADSKMADYMLNAGPLGTIKKFLKISKELKNMVEEARRIQGVNIAIVWPPDSGLDTLDSDPDQIKVGIKDSAYDVIRQFGETPPEKIDLYIPEKFRDQKAA